MGPRNVVFFSGSYYVAWTSSAMVSQVISSTCPGRHPWVYLSLNSINVGLTTRVYIICTNSHKYGVQDEDSNQTLFKGLFLLLLIMYIYVSVWGHVSAEACRVQKRVSDSQELALHSFTPPCGFWKQYWGLCKSSAHSYVLSHLSRPLRWILET